jgi:hypothetical protein
MARSGTNQDDTPKEWHETTAKNPHELLRGINEFSLQCECSSHGREYMVRSVVVRRTAAAKWRRCLGVYLAHFSPHLVLSRGTSSQQFIEQQTFDVNVSGSVKLTGMIHALLSSILSCSSSCTTSPWIDSFALLSKSGNHLIPPKGSKSRARHAHHPAHDSSREST